VLAAPPLRKQAMLTSAPPHPTCHTPLCLRTSGSGDRKNAGQNKKEWLNRLARRASMSDPKVAKVGGRGIVNRPRGHAEGSGGEGGVVDMLAKTRPGGAVL